MKKIGILLLLLGTLTFAHDGGHPYGILETRIEKKVQMQKVIKDKDFEVDYDVDIYKNQMNFEIELEGMKEPELNITEIVEKILAITSNEAPEVTEVYIVISYDPKNGNDRVLYSETHFLKKVRGEY